MFPNPASDKFTLSFGNEDNRAVKIYKANGELVISYSVTGAELTVDLNGFSPGIFFVKTQTEDVITSQKLILE